MSAEKPEAWDVWTVRMWDRELPCLVRDEEMPFDGGPLISVTPLAEREPWSDNLVAPTALLSYVGNVRDLLAGDPSALAAALAFAPPEVVTSAFVAACRADGKARRVRERLSMYDSLPRATPTGPNTVPVDGCVAALRGLVKDLGLLALLEPEPSEEGRPCEDEVLGQTAREGQEE